jgi:hypothetical protein
MAEHVLRNPEWSRLEHAKGASMNDGNTVTPVLDTGRDKQWVEGIKFEVLGNLRTDFTMLTYTNQPSRSRRQEPEESGRNER